MGSVKRINFTQLDKFVQYVSKHVFRSLHLINVCNPPHFYNAVGCYVKMETM